MASCGRKLIILMCHPQCISISSALWLLQWHEVGARAWICEYTGVRAIFCVHKYNYKCYVQCVCVTKRWGMASCLLLCLYMHCVQAITDEYALYCCEYKSYVCVVRGYFYKCVCMFVFIVAKGRLCCGQNNLASRCAEAGGKSIQTMAPEQVMSILA